MDIASFKALELLLIVGVVGYFYIRQRNNLQQLKEEREAKQAEEAANEATQANNTVPPSDGPSSNRSSS
ncbi:MAG: hypothetical protein VBE63_17785 [Lamprobacter sp.]|uniref:hypothetical protein n=1 Tax=Lamprobacter sp. TaxID=3100796 RepID=UPI002B260849|nr:hypothetical protein [Lamprobacter sp.]MEA3641768.1 hypothetical protein [Lamprobacter sp.]